MRFSLIFRVGVLRSLLTILSDEDTISVDAFKRWRDTDEEPEGKGKY